MRLVVDTAAPVAQHGNASGAALALTYLASYEHMGVCVVACERGCSCTPRAIDALQIAQPASAGGGAAGEALARNVSVATVAEIHVSSASECVVRLENAPRSGTALTQQPLGVSKFKLLQVRVGWDLGEGA